MFPFRPSPVARLVAHAVGVLSLVPAAAQAQDAQLALAAAQPLEAVVVSATRSPQPRADALADVSVIGRDDIERAGVFAIADLLARQPGVEIARSGGLAGTTSVFIRGSENRHVALYIDGVRVDSQSTGGPQWEQVPIEQIERVEVLRGPGAAVYGSDAIGGVVQLFTKRGAGPARLSAGVSVGSHDTRQVRAGLSGAEGAFDYALSAAQGWSNGFNARTTATANPDDDGWQRGAVQARVGFQVTPGHRLHASLLGTHLRSQYDSSRTADDVSRHTLRTAALGWQGRWSEASQSRFQLSESRTTYETRPSYYRTETTLRDYLLQHEERLGTQTVSAALERREDELLNPATAFAATLRGQRAQNALTLGWRGDFGAHALQVHARHDDDSEFGGKNTGSVAWGWRFAPQWRVTASAGTSFRAPTLYQRFSEYGVASLQPETGRNVEAGLRWAQGGSEVGATAWRNRVRNLINFGGPGTCRSSFGCYANASRAELEGVTLDGRTRVAGVSLRASLDWHDPRNSLTDKLLPRRAQRLATLGADTDWAGWSLGAEVQAASARFDDAANLNRLGGYGLLNLVAGRTLAPGLELQARVDNVADKDYATARTYATAGRTLLLALRWTQQ
ncbi:TonB-dependent receptor domain-containing protein [Azohydromonas aeria]|uniref:TonB-dependent receptor domain-containing protein n=1 Tax=Azohydromonas aeria TaxID=2590212 RepID=UPI0012FA7E6F